MSGFLSVERRAALISQIARYIGELHPLWLNRLEQTAEALTKGGSQVGGRGAPGSKPPGSLTCLSLARQIKAQGTEWDAILRRSAHLRPVQVAFSAIPHNADQADDAQLQQLWNDAGKWHRYTAIALGYISARSYRCRICGDDSLYVDVDGLAGRCYFCGFEYGRAHLWQLARNLGNLT